MKKQKGFSLIEVLVGILLVVVIFVGIINAFTLTLKVVFQSRARITALALAGKQAERIRNMSYINIGTVGGIPAGTLDQTIYQTLNNIRFTITTTIVNIDDSYDGVAPDDASPNDYKRAAVKVAWPGKIGGEIKIITDIAPKSMENGIGGTLSILVQDSNGSGVGQANVKIVNSVVVPAIDVTYLTDDSGYVLLPGAPASVESYQVTVSKEGYSLERTYARSEISNPNKPHLTIFANSLTESSFSIDKVSQLTVETRNQDSFDDEFNNLSKISDYDDIALNSGQVELAKNVQYVSSGYMFSQDIAPESLIDWDGFFFAESEPSDTDIKYHIYYATGTSWQLIPNSDLSGNSSGFDSSPVNFSNLDAGKYTSLKIGAELSTSNLSVSPTINDWHIYYNTSLISQKGFNIVGSKILGTDESGAIVYKYDQNKTTNSQGTITLSNIDADTYTFAATNGLNLARVYAQNPFSLIADATATVRLYFQATNSLLITVLDSTSSDPIFGATVNLTNESLGYQKELTTDNNGKAYFVPLDAATYNILIEADEYASTTSYANVSGDSTKTINLSTEPTDAEEPPPPEGEDPYRPPGPDPFF